MRRYLRPTLVSLTILWAGLALASFILCLGTGKLDQFSFPYWQWAVALWWFPAMLHWPFTLHQIIEHFRHGNDGLTGGDILNGFFRHPLLWFCLSSFVWVFVANVLISYLRRSAVKPSLYGDSHWADEAHMARHNIHSVSEPFV